MNNSILANDAFGGMPIPTPQRQPYVVYAKPNAAGHITAINSSAFLSGTTGYVEIDSGWGDKYHHAQGNYFPEPIITDGGAYRYKLVDGAPVECTEDEIKAQLTAMQPSTPSPTLESRVGTLETESTEMREALDMILSGVTE